VKRRDFVTLLGVAALNADARRFAERIEPIVSNFCRGFADDDMMHRLRRSAGPTPAASISLCEPQRCAHFSLDSCG
jgi:hypothetical protein